MTATGFQPQLRFPSVITKALNAVVTTTNDHKYVVGQTVKFLIPTSMIQLNEKIAIIQSVTSDTFTINIDTRVFNDFVASSASDADFSQILPIGDLNNGAEFSTVPLNRILGSFVKPT